MTGEAETVEPIAEDSRLGARFWRMWTAGVVNNLGDGALVIGVGLLATTITHDARLVAMVSAASGLPWLLVTLPAGALIDRLDRITAIRGAQLAQAAAMVVLTVLTALHVTDVPLLAVLAFLVTTGDVVFSVASQSVLPQIVTKPLLVKANSLNYVGQAVSYSFIGQSLGGLLFATSSALPFGFEAVSYLASAGLLTHLRAEPAGHGKPEDRGSARAWGEIVEGVRWLMRHRLLRTLALVLGMNTFANQMASAVLALFATQTLGVSRIDYGWMVGVSAIGGVVGGLAANRMVRRLGDTLALAVALTANAICYAATGLATNGYVVAGLLALVGFSVTIWNVVSISVRQSLVPAELLGRVTSVYRLLGWGLLPLGALVGGFLAHWLGLRAPFVATGAIRLVVVLFAIPVLRPALRSRQNSPKGEAEA